MTPTSMPRLGAVQSLVEKFGYFFGYTLLRNLYQRVTGNNQGERDRGFRGLLEPPGPLLTHFHSAYIIIAYSESLPTRYPLEPPG